MSTGSHAVFLSYASEDAPAAQRIADALRTAGIEVWFDQSELRGGDAWDRAIRRQIRECALFVPIISAHSQARPEGYFRLEWDLADQRTHLMGRSRAFVVPVCLDATLEKEADVPDSFVAVQWTRLPGGETPAEFVQRVVQLLDGVSPSARIPRSAALVPGRLSRFKTVWLAIGVVIVAGVTYLFIEKPWIAKPAPPAPSAFNPPPHSIAVLPFVNMSGDKDQDYFSDGLSDELLNDLARIDELQVAGRTSSFYFKGKDVDLETIARKLNVGAILEGSVRRSEHTVRVTAQLINSATGFHLWSETYDRDLGDVLKLETDIAHAVAGAMKVTLLGDVAEKVELGGTRNPAALDAYLHASQAFHNFGDATELRAAIAAFTEAIRLDPSYALALANRSVALTMYAAGYTDGPEIRNSFDAAQVDARKAIASAPDLAESHAAMGYFLEAGSLDFRRALEEYERAVALSPGNTFALQGYGRFAVLMGRTQAGVAAARRAVTLNPLDPFARSMLCQTLFFARQYGEAESACQESVALNPADPDSYLYRGLSQHALGNSYEARLSCEAKPVDAAVCLAIAYNSLGRHADAEAVLTKLKASKGNDAAYEYGEIYAQWGNTASALDSLAAALRVRESWLVDLKTDPLLDPVRTEPRFQAIERELRFPD